MLEGFAKLAADQGPLFWGAAASAALGASLVAAALVLHWRRRPWRLKLPRLRRAGRGRAATLPGLARAVAGGYLPAVPGARFERSAPLDGPDPAGDLAVLLLRLRRASDRLAALQTGLADSGLKGTPPEVDQMVRRGVG